MKINNENEVSTGWYDESLEERMNIVAQNGNDGDHYDCVDASARLKLIIKSLEELRDVYISEFSSSLSKEQLELLEYLQNQLQPNCENSIIEETKRTCEMTGLWIY